MIQRIKRRLLALGYSYSAANHIIATYLGRGALEELECIIDSKMKVRRSETVPTINRKPSFNSLHRDNVV